MIKTIEDAYAFVHRVKICTIFAQKTVHSSLWENVDLPDRQSWEKGRGQKVTAVWTWKNKLPALYPDEIFYGKIRGGHAVLMEMNYLRKEHFPKAYQPVENLSRLAQFTYEQVRLEPGETGAHRNLAISEYGATKSQFDTALKELQISLNVVRSNGLHVERDTWVTFEELYPEIWDQHVTDVDSNGY